jgi:predicted RNA-binding Zn-ribbon protein involved in translation (DUF1610 family)
MGYHPKCDYCNEEMGNHEGSDVHYCPKCNKWLYYGKGEQ